MRVLAVGAHSDDMDFFCGGTLARFAADGHSIGICSLTDGRSGGKPEDPDQLAAMRQAEFRASAAVIGAEAYWPGIEDGMLLNDLETRLLLVEIIRSFNPQLLITHPPNDYHPDHVATSQLVMDASFLARSRNIPTRSVRVPGVAPILFCDTEVGHDFLPEQYVDITDFWEQKSRMLEEHHSQYDGWKNPLTGDPENWVLDRASILSRFRGLQCGAYYAEAFRTFHAHGRVNPQRFLP
jgi:LmbE family N-acetylglucosaminyl deacetylase